MNIGDMVADRIAMRVYGALNLGTIETKYSLRDGTEVFGVVWDSDPTHTPEATYEGELILVQQYCKLHEAAVIGHHAFLQRDVLRFIAESHEGAKRVARFDQPLP